MWPSLTTPYPWWTCGELWILGPKDCFGKWETSYCRNTPRQCWMNTGLDFTVYMDFHCFERGWHFRLFVDQHIPYKQQLSIPLSGPALFVFSKKCKCRVMHCFSSFGSAWKTSAKNTIVPVFSFCNTIIVWIICWWATVFVNFPQKLLNATNEKINNSGMQAVWLWLRTTTLQHNTTTWNTMSNPNKN